MRQPRVWVSVTCGAILCAAWGTPPALAYRDNISYGTQSAEASRASAQTADEAAAAATQPTSGAVAEPPAQSGPQRLEPSPAAPASAQAAPVTRTTTSGGAQNNNISAGNGRAAQRKRAESAPTNITGKYKGARTNKWRELALSGDPKALDQLLHALQYHPGVSYSTPNSIRTRREAAEALGVLGDPAALRALEDALNDPDFLVRQHAAQSIAIITERNR